MCILYKYIYKRLTYLMNKVDGILGYHYVVSILLLQYVSFLFFKCSNSIILFDHLPTLLHVKFYHLFQKPYLPLPNYFSTSWLIPYAPPLEVTRSNMEATEVCTPPKTKQSNHCMEGVPSTINNGVSSIHLVSRQVVTLKIDYYYY